MFRGKEYGGDRRGGVWVASPQPGVGALGLCPQKKKYLKFSNSNKCLFTTVKNSFSTHVFGKNVQNFANIGLLYFKHFDARVEKGRKSVYRIARKLQKNCYCTYVPNS